jgi:hypothetical protein
MEDCMLSRTSLLGVAALAALLTAPAYSENKPATADKGFNPGTAQINQGAAHLPPAPTPPTPLADREDVRAALLMPDPGTISVGEQPDASGKPQPETTVKGITNVEGAGPIGSTMQTKPAKFSHRNDAIDHTPIMGMPFKLDAQQRQNVVQAVIAQKTEGAAATKDFNSADALPYSLAASIHRLPLTLDSMPSLAGLAYLKGKDKVYLVTTRTALPIVVDVLEGK